MTKASEYAAACEKAMKLIKDAPEFRFSDNSLSRLTSGGDIVINTDLILASDIPAFIVWLRETFE